MSQSPARARAATPDGQTISHSRLTFSFDFEKLVQALFLFSREGISDLTKLKAAKLFFFADKEHFLRYGRPILGDQYYCLDMGPIPSAALNLMTSMVEERPEGSEDSPLWKEFHAYLRVEMLGHPIFRAKEEREPDLGVFSTSDIEVLTEIARTLGTKTASQLIELTHKDAAWCASDENRPKGMRAEMPYELFLSETPAGKSERLLRVVREEQEARDFVDSL
jgi:uncharacterized phage-associated protein